MIIYHFIDSNGLFGAEKLLLSLILEQIHLGLKPKLVSIQQLYGQPKEIEVKAVQYEIKTIDLKTYQGINPLSLKHFIEFLKHQKIDIIHSHGYKSNVILGILRNFFLCKIPLLSTVHGYTSTTRYSKNYFYECLDRQILKSFDAVCIVDLLMKQRYFHSLSSRRNTVHFIPNGINTKIDGINQSELRKDIIDFCKSGFTIGSIGRFSNEKNYCSLIRAFNKFSRKIPSARLLLIGNGPLNRSIRNEAAKCTYKESIMLTGYIDDASQYMPYFDIFSLCSLTEGLPIVILEALLYQIPIIATEVGSIPYILKDVKSALLINNTDEETIYKGLYTMYINYSSYFSSISAGRQLVLSKYSISKTAQKYLSIYKSLV